MNKVVVFGNGQTASLVRFYLGHDSPYQVAAFTADGKYIVEGTLLGLPIVPFEDVELIFPPDAYKMIVQVSHQQVNRLRAEKYHQAKAKGYELISYVSSKATTWPDLCLGDNCFIFENVIVHPFAEIGNDVVIGPGSMISHHSVIKDHCFLAPNVVILGNVTVEPYSFLGANATIKEKVTIARECVIGANTFIQKDTQEKGVYVGGRAELLPIASDQLSALLTWPSR